MDIAQLIQQHYGSTLACLINKLGDITLAEDALQEANIAALNHWGKEIPKSPQAWLIKVGSNKAIDLLRKEKPQTSVEPEYLLAESINIDDNITGDEVLKLIFICCHPAIKLENQLLMTLKLVMGFNLNDISRVLLISEKALEQRLTRTKRKISANQISLDLPPRDKLQKRLSAVLQALYLIFNEGYHSSSGSKLLCNQICNQAIFMLKLTSRHYHENSACIALLSLMLFTHARSNARSQHSVIPLEEHDRSLYDQHAIQEADMLLKKSLLMGEVTYYHIEAAISGLHSQAASYSTTDWQQICLLYNKLLTYKYSPVVQLNKAVADMMLNNYSAALTTLKLIEDRLIDYPPFYLAQAQLYLHIDKTQQAIEAYQRAITLSHNTVEKAYIKKKLADIKNRSF